jgi:diacylglycerol kinase family enzyme
VRQHEARRDPGGAGPAFAEGPAAEARGSTAPSSALSTPPSTDPAGAAARGPSPDICILLNLRSGRKGKGTEDRLRAAAARHPGRFELRVIGRRGNPVEAAERAAADGFDTLVAAGGDGTIGAVAHVARLRCLTLGVLPMGTFNFFARGLGLPEELEAAVDLVARGPTRRIGIGEVNGRIFLNNASLGLYPAILAQREGTYRRWGRSRLAAHWSVLATFARFHRPLWLRVSVDGETIRTRTPLAFVARSAYQLDLFGLPGGEEVRGDRFALFLAPDSSRWHLLLFALRLAWHSMQEGRDYEFFSGRRIDIETDSPDRLVARDGERERMRAPFRFRMLDDALRVIAPEEHG